MNASNDDRLCIELLGRVRAWRGRDELTLGPPRRLAVLAVLALRANRVVPRDEIIDAVWGHDPPATAVNGVHVHVGALRQAIEPGRPHRATGGILTGHGSGYLLRLQPDGVDSAMFDSHLKRATRLVAAGELAAAVDAFDAALALWHGTPLTDLAGPLADAERTRLGELRLAALEGRAEAMLGLGHGASLVAELSALAAEHPLRERSHALLMTALHHCGRQAEALAVFAAARQHLVDELGIEPGPQLQRLHGQIFAGRDLDVTPRVATCAEHGVTHGAVPRQLPPAVRHFAGRTAELDTLTGLAREAVGGSGTVVISALSGMAGVGKTALALHWAHQVADQFPDGHLYVNLRGFDPGAPAMTPSDAVRGFLDALAVPPERIPTSLEAKVGLYRSRLARRRMLVVLDNALDTAQVRPLLPGSASCLVLVTSRNQLPGLVATEGAHPLAVDLLTPAESRNLLGRRLGHARVAAEPEAADELVSRCGRLPLALAIVAARAALHPVLTLTTLAGELRDAGDGLAPFSGGDLLVDVRAAFSLSYERLADGAAGLFRMLSLHPGPTISPLAAASLAAVPAIEARRMLAELVCANLVEERAADRYALHDLLRAYAGELSRARDSATDRRTALHRMFDHYLHTAHTAALLLHERHDPVTLDPPETGVTARGLADSAQALAWLTAEHSVLFAAVARAVDLGFDQHASRLAWCLWDYFDRGGHWHDWAATQRTALVAARRLADRRAEADAHRGLAAASVRLDRHDDAQNHYGEALRLYREIGDRTDQAYTHLSLGWLRGIQNCHDEALGHDCQALELFRAAGHLIGQARAHNAIGWYHAQLGDYPRALTHCQQALSLNRELGDRPSQANTWDSLAYIHHHLGDRQQATACYRRAIDVYREVGDRGYEAGTLISLGDVHEEWGDLDSAADAWHAALTILDQLHHPNADEARTRLCRLGRSSDRPGARLR